MSTLELVRGHDVIRWCGMLVPNRAPAPEEPPCLPVTAAPPIPARPGRLMGDAAGAASPGGSREAAFAEHVLPHVALLHRVALSLTGQSADAEDLVQDTLIRALRAVERFDGAYPRAWLLTVLRNTHLNRLRGRRPVLMREGESPEDHPGQSAPATEDLVLDAGFEAGLERALAALSPDHRAVVALVDVDGLSYEQAAHALGVPRGTVMSRLHRARGRLRADLVASGDAPRARRLPG